MAFSTRLNQVLVAIPALISLAAVVWWVLLSFSSQVCPKTIPALFAFVAYAGLLAFPLVVLLAFSLVKKTLSLDFGDKQKEVLVSLWVWLILVGFLAGYFLVFNQIVLPGASSFLCLN